MKRAFSQRAAFKDAPSLFGIFQEKTVLSNLLTSPKSVKDFPFVPAVSELQRLQQDSTAPRRPVVHLPVRKATEATEASTQLMGSPAVSSKELDQFLSVHYLTSVPPSERRDAIHVGLNDLISASSANNLRTLMQYLSKYWQIGLWGVRPSIHEARGQARAVLLRSLDIHQATEHFNGREQVGIVDFPRFEAFVSNFFNYLGVEHLPHDELDDLMLRISSKSGSLEEATKQLSGIEPDRVSEDTLVYYLQALAASRPTNESLRGVKRVLLNQHTGPVAVNFLLTRVQSIDDFFDLCEHINRSSQKLEVYERCQTGMVSTLLQISDNRLSLMFGFISRIQHAGVPLNAETIDVALQASMAAENTSAVNRLLPLARAGSQVASSARELLRNE